MSLPAADELFRRTSAQTAEAAARSEPAVVRAVPDEPAGAPGPVRSDPDAAPGRRRPSGRVRHDEKMTVYVTSAELLHLEQARLALRAEQGLAVDRGRLVREALALVLADFEEHGDESALVRRLTED